MDMQEQDPTQEQAPEAPESPKEEQAEPGMMVPVKALGSAGMNLKPGSTIEFTVDAVHGDMVELTPCSPDESDSEDMPTDEDAKSMPMDELESKLPHAER